MAITTAQRAYWFPFMRYCRLRIKDDALLLALGAVVLLSLVIIGGALWLADHFLY